MQRGVAKLVKNPQIAKVQNIMRFWRGGIWFEDLDARLDVAIVWLVVGFVDGVQFLVQLLLTFKVKHTIKFLFIRARVVPTISVLRLFPSRLIVI